MDLTPGDLGVTRYLPDGGDAEPVAEEHEPGTSGISEHESPTKVDKKEPMEDGSCSPKDSDSIPRRTPWTNPLRRRAQPPFEVIVGKSQKRPPPSWRDQQRGGELHGLPMARVEPSKRQHDSLATVRFTATRIVRARPVYRI